MNIYYLVLIYLYHHKLHVHMDHNDDLLKIKNVILKKMKIVKKY